MHQSLSFWWQRIESHQEPYFLAYEITLAAQKRMNGTYEVIQRWEMKCLVGILATVPYS
jgi:hypothetical protein